MAFFPSSRVKERKVRFLYFAALALLAFAAIAAAIQIPSNAAATGLMVACLFVAFAIVSCKLMIVRDSRIPVFAFHSVTDDAGALEDDTIAISPETFERIVSYLARNNYKTVFLDDLRKHISGRERLSPKAIVLTFDDGFHDNWVAVYPVLKKHKMAGTFFVPTDSVACTTDLRPTLDDVWRGHVSREKLFWRGYLNWPELQAMEAEGIADIQSHTKTHSWLPVSDQTTGFQIPGKFVVWRSLGTPVYPSKRAHVVKKAFKPSEDLANLMHRHVLNNGGGDFFSKPAWRAELQERYDSAESRGEWETDEEARKRLHEEMAASKSVLESHLDKKIRYLCWPGDEYTPELEAKAAECGYLATTALDGFNRFGENPSRIHRVYFPACRPIFKMHQTNYWSFVISLKLYRGNYFYYIPFILLNAAIRLINRTRRAER